MAAALLLIAAMPARAQETAEADPATTLSDILVAACRANETEFASHLTSANAAAFRALPATQRNELMKRLSLSDEAGKPLISADDQKHIVLHCRGAG